MPQFTFLLLEVAGPQALKGNWLACEFTPKLVEFYNRLKEKGEDFKVVLIPLVYEEEGYKESFETMPWLALPFKDMSCEKLAHYFKPETFPSPEPKCS